MKHLYVDNLLLYPRISPIIKEDLDKAKSLIDFREVELTQTKFMKEIEHHLLSLLQTCFEELQPQFRKNGIEDISLEDFVKTSISRFLYNKLGNRFHTFNMKIRDQCRDADQIRFFILSNNI